MGIEEIRKVRQVKQSRYRPGVAQRVPDFVTTAQDGGKVVSLAHRPHLPPGTTPGSHFTPGRSEGFMSKINSMTTSWIEPATF
jgi:hypothetical protein